MENIPHTSAVIAWNDLKARGGIEPGGRDEGIEEILRMRLNPASPSLVHALSTVGVGQLIRALFDSLHPYVEMCRDTLEFYRKAGAHEGRDHWQLVVDETPLELQHFRQFIESWSTSDSDIEAPEANIEAAEKVYRLWSTIPCLNVAALNSSRQGSWANDPRTNLWSSGDKEIDGWLSSYSAGLLLPFPSTLCSNTLEVGFSQLSALAQAGVATLLNVSPKRKDHKVHVRPDLNRLNREEALSLPTFAWLDHDNWFGIVIAGLAFARTLTSDQRLSIANGLSETFGQFSSKRYRVAVRTPDLMEILSLPVWKKRHELYGVWVATEIVHAAEGHDCTIHSDQGRIAFQFKTTLLSTIHTSIPVVKLYSERRVALPNPVDQSKRKGNAQPDYSLWRPSCSDEVCGLVIEVKHYKKTANRPFADVLTDYANAHPDAEVLLVNHGPIGDVLSKLDPGVAPRCQVLEKLTPLAREKRQQFRSVVSNYIGVALEPAANGPLSRPAVSTALTVDVSASMRDALKWPLFDTVLRRTANMTGATQLFPIDENLYEPLPIEGAAMSLLELANYTNRLATPVVSLLETYEQIFVITDEDGACDLLPIALSDQPLGGMQLRLITVTRASRFAR